MDDSDDSDAVLCPRRVDTSAIAGGSAPLLCAQCLVL